MDQGQLPGGQLLKGPSLKGSEPGGIQMMSKEKIQSVKKQLPNPHKINPSDLCCDEKRRRRRARVHFMFDVIGEGRHIVLSGIQGEC